MRGNRITFSHPNILAAVFNVTLLAFGLYMLRDAVSLDAVDWMNIFRVSDFRTLAGLYDFLWDLQTAIPPVIATLEILNHQLNGTTTFVSVFLYRGAFIGAYLLALWMAYPSIPRMTFTFLASMIFLYGAAMTHPGNPQVYDALYPFFILLFVFTLKRAEKAESPRAHLWLCALSGFFLSMTELSRPFFLMILPFALIGVWGILRKFKTSSFVYFLVPLLLFSGSWHVKMAARHHLIFWSNNGGFSLWRAWKWQYYSDPVPEITTIIEETNNPPLANDGRWENINTKERAYNSRQFQNGIFRWAFRHPAFFIVESGKKLLYFINTPTKLFNNDPQSPYMKLFRFACMTSFLFLFSSVIALLLKMFSGRNYILPALASADSMALIIAVLSTLILSLTEKGEEIRLIISILPLLTLFPFIIHPIDRDAPMILNRGAQNVLFILGFIFLLLSGIILISPHVISERDGVDYGLLAAMSALGMGIFCAGMAYLNKLCSAR